jgi:hypothetical protein
MYCFWLFEFKFEFEFNCLFPFLKMQNLFFTLPLLFLSSGPTSREAQQAKSIAAPCFSSLVCSYRSFSAQLSPAALA